MTASTRSLRLDLSLLCEAGLPAGGVTAAELDGSRARAAAAHAGLVAARARGEVGFLELPDDVPGARAALDFARDLPPEIDNVVVLGIGGSSLGPHALYSALAPPYHALRPRSPGMPRRLFFPDNSDPATFRALVDLLPPDRTVWNAITKSGATAETAAQLLVVWHRLEALGPERARRHLVVTTDPTRGALRQLAGELGLTSFAVPPSVGGRFSVLSPVGLVPAACAGLDVVGLLAGSRAMRDRILAPDLDRNPALLLATLLHLQHTRHGRPLVVVMPYADGLYDIADWFRQLWAESLGKERATDGRVVHVGPTPIASRGATDQHSQLQLYAEGPADKVFLFLTVAERGPALRLPDSAFGRHPDYAYLAGRGMGELIDAELRGTVSSLTRRGRPSATLTLGRQDAASLGELLMLFMAATAFAGPLYGVDPFDQPGVEEAKRLAFVALGRPGFAELRAQLEAVRSVPELVL